MKAEPIIKPGDILYRDSSSKYDGRKITKVIVESVGRIYFTLKDGRDKITISTLTYENKEYSQFNYHLYRSEQEIKDKWEAFDLWGQIRLRFTQYVDHKFTVDQLRRLSDIINEKP